MVVVAVVQTEESSRHVPKSAFTSLIDRDANLGRKLGLECSM